MKQLMELLGLDIPKWEGPTVCESSSVTSEPAADMKPPKKRVKKDLVKEERRQEATQLPEVKEETVAVKKETAELPVGTNEQK